MATVRERRDDYGRPVDKWGHVVVPMDEQMRRMGFRRVERPSMSDKRRQCGSTQR